MIEAEPKGSFTRGMIAGISSTIGATAIAFLLSGYKLQAINTCVTAWSLLMQ